MNKIWLEKENSEGEWVLMNNGKPLVTPNGDLAENPSIDVIDSKAAIAYQVEGGGYNFNIYLKIYNISGDIPSLLYEGSVIETDNAMKYPDYNCNPVVKMIRHNVEFYPVMVAWQLGQTNLDQGSGILLRFGKYDNVSESFSWKAQTSNEVIKLPNTNSDYKHPSIGSITNSSYENNYKFHLAYDDGVEVYYRELHYDGNIINISSASNITEGSGDASSIKPSISVAENGVLGVAWLGTKAEAIRMRKNSSDNANDKQIERIVATERDQNGNWSSTFYKYGYYPSPPVIRVRDNNGSISEGIAWSQGSNNYFVYSYNSGIYSFNTSGDKVQLSDGITNHEMYVMSLSTGQQPYSFKKSNSMIDAIFHKTNSQGMHYAREGIVSKDSSGFYYVFGDIMHGENPVEFVEKNDSIQITGVSQLNDRLMTKPIEVNDNSTLSFSVHYGLVDSTNFATLL